jgi:hypothetical protein
MAPAELLEDPDEATAELEAELAGAPAPEGPSTMQNGRLGGPAFAAAASDSAPRPAEPGRFGDASQNPREHDAPPPELGAVAEADIAPRDDRSELVGMGTLDKSAPTPERSAMSEAFLPGPTGDAPGAATVSGGATGASTGVGVSAAGGVHWGAAPAAGPTYRDASAPAPAAAIHEQVLRAVVAQESAAATVNERRFELLLDPPELGRLLIQMQRGLRGVEVRIAAEDAQVDAWLRTSAHELEQTLQTSQFTLGGFTQSDIGSSPGRQEFGERSDRLEISAWGGGLGWTERRGPPASPVEQTGGFTTGVSYVA